MNGGKVQPKCDYC